MDMTWHLVWKCALTVVIGIALMRLSGRKSIAQMNVATTVIMISVGELLASGIIENKVWRTAASVALFLITLLILEWFEVKSSGFQKWLSGEPIVIIRDGQADDRMLRRMRITRSQLHMRLRQKGIGSLSEVRVGTIEINGELGFELYPDAKPLTVGEMEKLLVRYGLLPAESGHQSGFPAPPPEPGGEEDTGPGELFRLQ